MFGEIQSICFFFLLAPFVNNCRLPSIRDGATEGRATKGRKTECRRPEVEKLECRRLKVERPNVERLNVEEGERRRGLT